MADKICDKIGEKQLAEDTVKILGIAGSLRKGSFNRALVRAAKDIAPDDVEIEIFHLDDIPLYNADVEAEGMPAAVKQFHDRIRANDAVLIATPEYQYGVPGVLKNAIDWASRPPKKSPMQGKPVAVMGATPGRWGTARAQTQLRQALYYNASPIVVGTEVLVATAKEKFNEDLELTDEQTRKFVGQLVDDLVALTRLHSES